MPSNEFMTIKERSNFILEFFSELDIDDDWVIVETESKKHYNNSNRVFFKLIID